MFDRNIHSNHVIIRECDNYLLDSEPWDALLGSLHLLGAVVAGVGWQWLSGWSVGVADDEDVVASAEWIWVESLWQQN